MTVSEAKEILENEKECVATDCDRHCWKCPLVREEKDILKALEMAITALEENSKLKTMVDTLADCLDGCPLNTLYDDMWSLEGWCAENCKWKEPSKECWIKWAEVMASE